jgi:hypothetical protein
MATRDVDDRWVKEIYRNSVHAQNCEQGKNKVLFINHRYFLTRGVFIFSSHRPLTLLRQENIGPQNLSEQTITFARATESEEGNFDESDRR